MNKKPTVEIELDVSKPGANVYIVISVCAAALRKAGLIDAAREFTSRAFSADSYDNVLNICGEYLTVKGIK